MTPVALRRSKNGKAVDAWRGLGERLSASVRGEVRFDAQYRALYATDGSNYRFVPVGVVLPRDAQDVLSTFEICRHEGVPILARGGGTSLAGQCCNAAVILDFSHYMNRVLQVDAERRLARVEPGAVLDALRAAAEPYGLTYGPDPSTHAYCTFGGMIGNNSCGVHGVLSEFYGPGPRTDDNVEELEILTYDGLRFRVGATSDEQYARILGEGGRRAEIYAAIADLCRRYETLIRTRFPNIQRRVSGYNLPALLPENGFNLAQALVGSEGTCVTVLEASVRLSPLMPERVLVVVGYPDVYAAADDVLRARRHKPIGCEGIDDLLVDHSERAGIHKNARAMLPEGKGWLLVEFGSDDMRSSLDRAEAFAAESRRDGHSVKIVTDKIEQEKYAHIRESGLGATAFVPGERDTWEGWEDSAVPVDKVGDYLRELRRLFERYEYHGVFYGHFGQGCIHTRIDFDLTSDAGIAKYASFTSDAADLVVSFGGSLSGEHGDGQSRAGLLPRMFGDEICQAFREFKRIWDPEGRMNPGKVVDAYDRTEHLRLGAGYAPMHPDTHFRYEKDHGDFSHAALRCVGVGKCRRESGGTMCPSYMATRLEQHTTRGRAHLLFEMLRGETITDGWQSEEVHDALHLCLSCKGCKKDCPVGVDIATYKAEFLSHYYEGKLRPRSAYAFGLIHRWASIGARIPRLANFVTHTGGLSAIAKWLVGAAPQRDLPAFAHHTFHDWYARRKDTAAPDGETDRPRVVLWADTFNDHFHPDTLIATFEVLRDAGCDVRVSKRGLCCGRPLYDYGMLDRARLQWREILDALSPEIDAGAYVVGVEPSCVAAFRDELTDLMWKDARAHRLAERTLTLGEFLSKLDGYEPPRLARSAIVHGHCHHKSVLEFDPEMTILKRMGIDAAVPEPGCCGMAGSFGFEHEKYDISTKIGERSLLPAVRAAEPDTLIIADGFSCREQIRQGSTRHALHLAEVLRIASGAEQYTESSLGRPRPPKPAHHTAATLAVFLLIAVFISLMAFLSRTSPAPAMVRDATVLGYH